MPLTKPLGHLCNGLTTKKCIIYAVKKLIIFHKYTLIEPHEQQVARKAIQS